MIPPGSPLVTGADIDDFWTQVMGPLRFGDRRLWIAFLDGDHRLLTTLPIIDGVPEVLEPELADRLMSTLDKVVPSDGSIILLLSRPGGPMGPPDRALARVLHTSADRHRLPLQAIHLATETHLRQFAPDDLVSAA